MTIRANIYHNPDCSKSRATLDLLHEAGADVTVVHYLENPPTAADLARLIARAGLPPHALLRPGAPPLEEDDVLEAIAADPTLLERPLVETARGVVLARPPERIRDIL